MKSNPRIPNIVQAMEGIFWPWFPGQSWDGWRSVLRATAALPMGDAEIEFLKSIAGGREPPKRRPREVWIIAGRRGGKDSAVSLIAAHAAATFSPKGILRPGERAVVACLAPDKDTARIIQRYIRAFFEEIPQLKKMVTRVTDETLELSNQVDISVMTANWRTVRGRPILCGILDECAMMDTRRIRRARYRTLQRSVAWHVDNSTSATFRHLKSVREKRHSLSKIREQFRCRLRRRFGSSGCLAHSESDTRHARPRTHDDRRPRARTRGMVRGV